MDLTQVRMREHSGMITNDTSTTQFSFVVSPLKNRAHVEKNDYIAINHPILGETYPIIATVKEIRSYEQIAGSTLSEKVGKMMATAEIVGYVNLNDKTKQIKTLVVPPNPGARVYLLYSEFIQEIYTTDTHGQSFNPPLYIGKTNHTAINQKEETKQLNLYMDSRNVTDGHTLITAIDTMGKTHTTKVIIEELVNKTQQPIVVFDPYNEYNNDNTKSPNNFTTAIIETPEKVIKTIKPKQLTILTLQNVALEDKNNVYTQALKILWKARLDKTIQAFTLIIENAEKIDLDLLEQVVYDGAKYGIALILLSKQPAQLGTKILTQINTQIIGKTADTKYLNHLEKLLPQHILDIPKLKQGEWILTTDCQQPITKMKARKS